MRKASENYRALQCPSLFFLQIFILSIWQASSCLVEDIYHLVWDVVRIFRHYRVAQQNEVFIGIKTKCYILNHAIF